MKRLMREVFKDMKRDIIYHTEIVREHSEQILFCIIYYAVLCPFGWYSTIFLNSISNGNEAILGIYVVFYSLGIIFLLPMWILSYIPRAKRRIEEDDDDVIDRLGA